MRNEKIVMFFGILIVSGFLTGFAGVIEPFIPVSEGPKMQGWVQAGYNCNADEYLVVWEDYRNADCDIYGQFVDGDGTLIRENFPVCDAQSYQFWPHLDFDPANNRFLVVFEDYRNGNDDVYGVFIDSQGKRVWTATSEPDTSFPISTDSTDIYAPSVAFNYKEGLFLVVWSDTRNPPHIWGVGDIYAQLVNFEGKLIEPTNRAGLLCKNGTEYNFPIAVDPTINEWVPDVSYSEKINEWLVVFGVGDYPDSEIFGQRVDREGNLLKKDGTPGSEKIKVSHSTGRCPDGAQARVQYNNETHTGYVKVGSVEDPCECLVTWTRVVDELTFEDNVYCQRLAFIPDAEAVARGWKQGPGDPNLFFAAYRDSTGKLYSNQLSNYPVSTATGGQSPSEIGYSVQDKEWLVAWGDQRDFMTNSVDVYCQRLTVKQDSHLVWLNAERNGLVNSSLNIPMSTTTDFEGAWNILGVAHSPVMNEFLVGYTHAPSVEAPDSCNIHGKRISGSAPTEIQSRIVFEADGYILGENYPNPFNPETVISYTLPVRDKIDIVVFDLMGRKVHTLFSGIQERGSYLIEWSGENDLGVPVPSGVYLYRIQSSSCMLTRKMTLLR